MAAEPAGSDDAQQAWAAHLAALAVVARPSRLAQPQHYHAFLTLVRLGKAHAGRRASCNRLRTQHDARACCCLCSLLVLAASLLLVRMLHNANT